MARVAVLLLLLEIVLGQQEPFRTELFPEQLEQQRIQFRQGDIQRRIQQLQQLQQVASGPRQGEILLEIETLDQESKRLQADMLRLQEDIQRRLAGLDVPFNPQTIEQPSSSPPPPPQPVEEQKRQIPPTTTEAPDIQEDFVLPCNMETGEEGLCRPLVKCLSFYADVPELRKQPCPLGKNQGVCCPLKTPKVSGGGPTSSGVLRSPPPPPVQIPPLTPQNLETAAETGVEAIKDRFQFLVNLFSRGIIVQPGTPAKWHLDFFPTTNETLAVGDQAQKNIQASKALVDEFSLSPAQGTFALPKFSLLNTVLADTCPPFIRCFAAKYRTMDGSCNNLANPHWGQAGTALQRILPPKYADGVNAPRTGEFGPLPSPRLITLFYATDVEFPSNNYTMMVMQWGQFLDHDLTHTPISRGASGSGISCCREGQVISPELRHPDCFPIDLPRNDRVFAPFGERCMEFARSLPAPRPECNFGPREQMNQITGYLDASNIYGSNRDTARSLRLFRGGFLRAQNVRGRAYLPGNPNECTDRTNRLACFSAGDGRVNEQVDLALIHTVWLREHNRIASILQRIHPEWSDEAIFQEAKRIVIAEYQHITYNEYLPILLGRAYMEKSSLAPKDKGWTTLYDPNLNGGITNVFATAAFRFGHSQIQSFLHGYGRFGNIRQNLEMSKNHFAPFMLYSEGAVDDMLRGLAAQPMQNVDRHFSNQITDHLFQGNLDIGLDLVSLNIQRGRDHGLAPYNDWREVCGLRRAQRWEDLEEHMEPSTIEVIARLYQNVDDIDLFVGAMGENPVQGAILGPTFLCLIGDQFARLRRADRFFYEEANQPSSFSSDQLTEIRKTSLARILCDNSDDLARIQPLAFIQPSFLNQRIPCDSRAIPSMDLRAWINESPATR
ncbi:peroxidase [Halyomorpha halys]|uniref:peroxidase n=1 Tax=Halyomorpha halys TaxID=286706 RepID=UPI0006D50021|nr:peroxidase-like isoform X1 [Halyomorpha halys]